MAQTSRSPVPTTSVRYAFVGYGYTATGSFVGLDRLFLDVGNQLAPGVIDHHQASGDGPTARLVCTVPALIDAAINPDRRREDPFHIVLHQAPDLDAVASTALALEYLETRAFPARADELIRYVERADSGESCVSPDHPFTLYAAFLRIAARTLATPTAPEERWTTIVHQGVELVRFALTAPGPLAELDAFQAPGLFTAEEREVVRADVERFRRKLADPATAARRFRLHFHGRSGGEMIVEGLVVRGVQNPGDPDRVTYFKDWARGSGYAALSVFMSEEMGHPRRCILSLTPGCGASLEGLGGKLDAAESARRITRLGQDDRKFDLTTGEPLRPRPGYDNADPWYDGRGHSFTIVDAPRSGTVLTADEIEEIFLTFGRAESLGPATE